MEKLSQIISTAVSGGLWKPIRAGKDGPQISHLAFADDLMIFMEASEDQYEVLSKCLSLFEEASGMKLSVEKTSIFFSKNSGENVIQSITAKSGFKLVKNVGRYLGAMMQHGRASKELYANIIEKVRAKLNVWQQHSLSQAGRVTLAQAVMSAIPFFQMQHCKLPHSVCLEIERIQRKFIWGDKDNIKKKPSHRVGHSYSPQEGGGLGLKRLEVMNDAFLAKKAWQFWSEPDQLWAKVLQAKYASHSSRNGNFVCRNGDSSLWRNLCRLWKEFEGVLMWEVGDGRSINFWNDHWISNTLTLRDCLIDNSFTFRSEDKVADMVTSGGEWNFTQLSTWFPADIVQLFRSFLPPQATDGKDSLYWRVNDDNIISVKSLYDFLLHRSSPFAGDSMMWDTLWDWKGIQKSKLLMWKVLHGRLLTRSHVARWGIGDDLCPICRNGSESILHALRYCEYVNSIWRKLVRKD